MYTSYKVEFLQMERSAALGVGAEPVWGSDHAVAAE
jgi:hypothetical protein